jgi:hypothetical protein
VIFLRFLILRRTKWPRFGVELPSGPESGLLDLWNVWLWERIVPTYSWESKGLLEALRYPWKFTHLTRSGRFKITPIHVLVLVEPTLNFVDVRIALGSSYPKFHSDQEPRLPRHRGHLSSAIPTNTHVDGRSKIIGFLRLVQDFDDHFVFLAFWRSSWFWQWQIF